MIKIVRAKGKAKRMREGQKSKTRGWEGGGSGKTVKASKERVRRMGIRENCVTDLIEVRPRAFAVRSFDSLAVLEPGGLCSAGGVGP